LLLIIIGTYVVATCFFSVYSMAVDTLFICALEDMRMKDKDPNHEMVMPKGLRKVFRAKKDKMKV
jgi:choline transporter-like protein 2/4/5